MKTVRLVIAVVLLVLIILAWFVQGKSYLGDQKQYAQLLEEAEAHREEKLYQQAIQAYEKAFKIKDTEEAREKWITVYELAYQDGVVTQKDYANALLSRCEIHPKEAKNWEQLLELYLSTQSYKKAHEILEKLERAGAKSDKLSELSDTVRYSYTDKGRLYSNYFRSPDGYYTLLDEKNWGVMKPDGEWLHERNYFYSGPVGLSHEAVLQTSRDTRVIDEKAVVQAIVSIEFEEMRAVAAGLIPIKNGAVWGYFDYTEGNVSLRGYEDASSFTDQLAAVKQNGKWKLIKCDGTTLEAVSFDDVKLFQTGEYAYKNVMVAAADGSYGFYDAKGNALSDFRCKDADCCYGDAIAYQDDSGKWGFVNEKGEILLTPKYEQAKSFSNGLAAVCVNGKWGFINKDGKIVVNCQYAGADYFTKEGLTMVMNLENQYHMIQLRFPLKEK